MRLATWNVNSLKVRLPRIEAWLAEVQPDVACLQETKVSDSGFPALAFGALGYEAAHHGQGQWNGVAILSKVGLADVVVDFADGGPPDVDARLITATCAGVRTMSVYVPNGRALEDDHYQYKLAWLARLKAHLAATCTPGMDVAICGDFNIAPTDNDVYDASKFAGATHVSRPERAALAELEGWGLHDAFRAVWPDAEKVFSWWDYRAGDFHEGRGMRIDLVLASASLASRIRWAVIDRNARK